MEIDLESIAINAKPLMVATVASYVGGVMWFNYFRAKFLLDTNSKKEVEKKICGGERSFILKYGYDWLAKGGYISAFREYDDKLKEEKKNPPKSME